MPKLPRKTQKIFAGSADNNGVFGSAADNTKVLSNDLDVIQSKPAYNTGWITAVLGQRKYPALEEFQALQYMFSYQLKYIFENGIPEYDASTEYYSFSVVRQTGTYQLYGSAIDSNMGNPLNDTNYWTPLINLNFGVAQATESVAGIAKIATSAQITAGDNDETIVTPLKLAPFRIPTGAVFAYALGTSAPSGYVMIGGRTIGNAASGATERANADTQTLFEGLWDNFSNTLLPIQDSSGSPVSRGVSAAADFAANRRLPTLDARGRVIAGLDNMGGTPAGRLSGQPGGVNGLTMGNSGGLETHSMTGAQNGPHNHLVTRGTAQYSAGSGTNNYGGVRDTNPLEPPYMLVGSSGQGSPHNNVQPTLILPFIMKL